MAQWIQNSKEMVGQSLNVNKAIKHYKASGPRLSTILYKPEKAKTVPNHNTFYKIIR
jgi:glutamate synthase (ferredoxin)